MSVDFAKVFGTHAQALELRAKRAEVLANNIANQSTPQFKAKDLDFQQALDQALGSGSTGLVVSNSQHIGGLSGSLTNLPIMEKENVQASPDGNTVDAEKEKVQFSKNSVEYLTSLNFLNHQIARLKTAIKGD